MHTPTKHTVPVLQAGRSKILPLSTLAATLLLGGCALPTYQQVQMAEGEAAVMQGPGPRHNGTPLDGILACLSHRIVAQQGGKAPLSVAVGDIKDYTGKYSQGDGNVVTQGGALMVYSALGKLGGAIDVRERFDTRVAELELAYTDRRQLGDGNSHALADDKGQRAVPWLPYYGGSILKSDYYIIGGLTEVNYNIQSGGIEAQINQIGPRYRVFTMNVGADLRIVETRTLRVVRAVSLQKQIVGREIGAGIFRFFGSNLFDINAGSKDLEPVQLGVRTTLEQGVIELISTITQTPAAPCLEKTGATEQAKATATPPEEAPPAPTPAPAQPTAAAPQAAVATEPLQESTAAALTAMDVVFEENSNRIAQQSATAAETVATRLRAGQGVRMALLAREREADQNPTRRDELTDARIQALRNLLAQHGVPPDQIRITWRPSPGDNTVHRYGAGYRLLAKLQVTP
ncbi:curli biogenesis system outer membrane secretion channel CsgG [Comamonas odontotermitis]|uniref:Curli biogenesis system outer membrane secretion channel CsgG n=1 Tax=Comamonas odontotermitis TaxID=379895 RepID=A0ABR6RG73_9BURK|nr:CsgG/HfaB family protein [Comamonas odontotermitis]MBB6578149.1 curli biogenesis system outer membrane secretion channel CsgG [Comamonas odontotermitis]